jgi:membrane-associated protease RseP (regulator of RpoE activity)
MRYRFPALAAAAVCVAAPSAAAQNHLPVSVLVRDSTTLLIDHARTLRLIAAEFEKNAQAIISSGVSAEPLLLHRAGVFRELQRSAQDALVRILSLCSGRPAARAYMGAEIDEPFPDAFALMGVADSAARPRILSVRLGSPAQRAGVVAGDLVLEINGVDTRETGFARFVVDAEPGYILKLLVDRGGRTQLVRVELGVPPANFESTCELVLSSPEFSLLFHNDSLVAQRFKVAPLRLDTNASRFRSIIVRGKVSASIPDSVASTRGGAGIYTRMPVYLGAQFWSATPSYFVSRGAGAGGAPILMVAPNTPAERSGLRAHDIVVRVGQWTVSGLESLRAALDSVRGSSEIGLHVLREGKPMTVLIRLR